MGSRAILRCFVKHRCDVSTSTFSALSPRCEKFMIAVLSSGKLKYFSSSSPGNLATQSSPSEENVTTKTSIESTEFKKNISDFAKSFGVTQNMDILLPAFTHKSYLIAHATKLKNQHKHNEQLALLGLQVSKRFITELLTHHFPHLSAQELWDTQNGLLESHIQSVAQELNIKELTAFEDVDDNRMSVKSLLAFVAVVYIHEGSGLAKQLLNDKIISSLNEEQIKDITKLQHPKYIFKTLCQKTDGDALRTRVLRRRQSKSQLEMAKSYSYKVGIFRGDHCMAVGMGSTAELAEKKVCQKALCNLFPDDLKNFNLQLDSEDFEPEDKIDLGLVTSQQRVLTLEKGDGGFGFNIKGGEKKRLKNDQWLIYNYFSPIFINSILPDGLASRLRKLRVGDMILAVNDRSLIGLDHATAVKLLQSVTGTVTLTVKHSKEVLITDRVETEYKKMKQRKRLAELTSDVWAEWHQAQADKHPEKYADVLSLEQNIAAANK